LGKRSSDQLRALATTIVLLAIWLLLPVATRSLLRVGFYEFQAPSWHAISWASDLQSYWALRTQSKHKLIERGRDVSRVNAAYRLLKQENDALKTEMATLQNALNLPSLPQYRYEVARVARRELNAWWQHIIIRKGRNYNIPVGAAVVFHDGVVGRVKEVRYSTSVVELLSSPSFRIAATFDGDTRPVTYQGSRRNLSLTYAWGEVRDVPPDIKTSPDKPRRLISSRLGGIFPQGLYIGDVISLKADNNGLFSRGVVRLSPDIRDIHEVAVLIPVSPAEESTAHAR